jgi:transcriptional regulator with XRE-family HTH domain
MKTLSEVGAMLQDAKSRSNVSQKELASRTGLTPVTLRGVFNGTTDSRISTIMALADELGLELVLVPKLISHSIAPHHGTVPPVKSRIAGILDRTPGVDVTGLRSLQARSQADSDSPMVWDLAKKVEK